MASTLSRRLRKKAHWLAPIALLGLYFPIPGALRAQTGAFRQHFACGIGYTGQQCQAATAVLRKAVTQYPVDELGEWTWILVRPVDWKRNLSTEGIDPNDPAFSNLTKRKTFLDGSLVEAASIRSMELRAVWHVPVEELLDLTIRHELAHALCNERDERRADRIALTLKNGAPANCRTTRVAKNHRDTRTFYATSLDRQDRGGGATPARQLQHHNDADLPQASVNPAGHQSSSGKH